jgi:FkbM family methyltransferase
MDPDLKLNENLPSNFVEILSDLSDTYKTSKIGFALDISDSDKFYKIDNYAGDKSIREWEKQFWENKIDDPNYELYNSIIDTTFCLIDKSNGDYQIRVAGNFTAKHLPWYIESEVYNVYENYINTTNTNGSISTISKIIKSYIEDKYSRIQKNDELFLIENNEGNPNLPFWKDIYSQWERETFDVFDRCLSKDKVFIDIGGWIGTTAMYGSRKSKHVYSVEADNNSFRDMSANLKTNCINNYTLINKAIFNKDNVEIKFGKNVHLENSKMNDSTSQIYSDDTVTSEYYITETITIGSLIEKYKIDVSEISLIKVDIEGGEENILDELFDIHVKYGVSLYVSFHYSWWKDKNLDRFAFLSSHAKSEILAYPFTSILF